MMKTRTSLVVVSFLLLPLIYFPMSCFAIIHPVTFDIGATIQDMIDAAEEGDTVLVLPGTYCGEGNRCLDFHGKDISLLSRAGADSTVLDCENEDVGIKFHSGETTSALVRGFKVINGDATEFSGGIDIRGSSPSIGNCIFENCFSTTIYCENSLPIISDCEIYTSTGSAIMVKYDSNLEISSCRLENNYAALGGAGLYSYSSEAYIHDTIICNNFVEAWSGFSQGGGIYSYESDIIVERCEISNNTCEGGWIAFINGGGIYCKYGSVIISDCLILGNSADYGGGGGLQLLDTDSAVIDNCFITGNSSTGGCGGGISVEWSVGTTFSNCLIIDNHADSGGGIYGHCYSFQMTNCTLTDNSAGDTGGGIRVFRSDIFLSDCISVNNHPEEISCQEGSADVTWTNIEGGWPGGGNIDEEPLFVAPGYGDYRLLWGSPCIDSGNPDSLDLDGTVRDMGARSFDQSKELIVYLSPETREIAPGDSARVKYTVCNAHPNEKNFGTAAGVRLPDGAPWPVNPLQDPFYTSIAPSSNLTREFEYRVPLAWPEGAYSLAAGVGYDARIFDLDHFEFTVAEDTTSRR